jgi:hypothetical protein
MRQVYLMLKLNPYGLLYQMKIIILLIFKFAKLFQRLKGTLLHNVVI